MSEMLGICVWCDWRQTGCGEVDENCPGCRKWRDANPAKAIYSKKKEPSAKPTKHTCICCVFRSTGEDDYAYDADCPECRKSRRNRQESYSEERE